MVSRDTAVQLSIGLLAVAGFLVLPQVLDLRLNTLETTLLLIGFYAAMFGGSHLLLAWRGEDGVVPVSSRWRFVALVGTLSAVGAGVHLLEATEIVDGGEVFQVGLAIGVLALVLWWVLEARSGYEAARQGST